MRAWVLAFAAVAAIGAVAGCNDDTVVTGGTPGASAPATTPSGGNPAPGGTNGSPSTVASPVTSNPSRDDANVDARDFQQGDKYYFQSPTGNIMCGFINEGAFGTGCQLEHVSVVPAELPDCGTRADRAVAANITGSKAKFICLNQGVFVGSPTGPVKPGNNKGGGKVLEYGQTIIVRGVACTSTQAGVRCDSGGHGFLIAADQQQLF
ncbi:hypothetical protein OHB26_16585 [Nocardia sp. NBC_01503]|uniref:hypothetical protein n=1 Tax=Nocardia sp. NBC_01503 TaxID=2975997 RepID=UPI002E7BE4B8|nr:hypothetical protein [Nocardia sp. NBC_01503]WTL35667.1 hypothetical protein OHB26_16585 [Nocardia sp. NBC_01503]